MDEKIKFNRVTKEEQETSIIVSYSDGYTELYTSRPSVYVRLYKSLGEPFKTFYAKDAIDGAYWRFPFHDRKSTRQLLSISNLIGEMGVENNKDTNFNEEIEIEEIIDDIFENDIKEEEI